MRLWILEGSAVRKRKVTMELTVEQAEKVHDLLCAGMQDLCNGYYSPEQEAAADRA